MTWVTERGSRQVCQGDQYENKDGCEKTLNLDAPGRRNLSLRGWRFKLRLRLRAWIVL